MLLLRGWKRQQCSSAPVMSRIVRMHSPDATFHSRAVPSNETDRMISLERDQAKSENITAEQYEELEK